MSRVAVSSGRAAAAGKTGGLVIRIGLTAMSYFLIEAAAMLLLDPVTPLVLGFGLSAAAAALGSPCLFSLSAIMILSGGGDVLIAWKLLLHRAPDAEVRYLDHPYECGLVAFERPR